MKKLLLVVSLCISVLSIFAQNFQEINITQSFSIPLQVEAFDFNNDGLDDIVTIGHEDLYLYMNQGSLGFEKISLVDSIDFFRGFDIFDWENDGDFDIAFTKNDYYTGLTQVAWLENDGFNNFTYHLISTAVLEPLYVRVFDIDNDNDLDFLVSDSEDDKLYMIENDGLNNFTNIDTLGSYINQFEIADLNGDNDWDIIYGKAYTGISYSSVRCLQNDGSNNFSMITLKSGFNIIPMIKVVDVNNDGDFDIVVADSNADKLVWLKNNGSDAFPTATDIKTSWDGASKFDVGDINGDNKMDIVGGSTGSDEIFYFQGQGSVSSYSFSSGTEIDDNLNYISGITIGNFDNQTNMDFAHIDQNEYQLALWVNNGSQSFSKELLASRFSSPRAYDMKDLDGDGDQDFAAVSNDGDMVVWFENIGDDEFEQHTLITNYEEPYTVRINDLDLDGDNDIVAASNDDDRVSWWENDGTGGFTLHHISTNINGPRDLCIEDFDQDGDKDVAVIGYATPSSSGNTGAWWFRNDGFQNFTMIEIEDGIDGGRSIRAAEMTGDSLIDLVISSYYYGDDLFVAVNTGTGFYDVNIATIRCEDFELVDFDLDNDMDILAIDFNEDSLYFYENQGSTQFVRHTLAYKYRLYAIDPVDYDNDGDIDIIYGTGYSGYTNGSLYELGIYRNDGLGNLTAEIWDQNLTMIKPVEALDYEEDGDYDIVVGFDYSSKITMYKNLEINCPLSIEAVAQGPISFCPGGAVQINGITTDTDISYQWFNGTDTLFADTLSNIIVSGSGDYFVEISDSTCASESNTIVVDVVVNDTTVLDQNICSGDSVEINGTYYSMSGSYMLNLTDQFGCDSVVEVNISVNPEYFLSLHETICWGETFDFNGTILSQAGVYTDAMLSEFGCDSIHELDLLVLSIDSSYLSENICEGDTYTFEGSVISQSGTYSEILVNQSGCDSVVILDLTVNQIDTTFLTQFICEGSTFDFHGNLLTAPGVYYHTLQNQYMCDSVIMVDLFFNPIDTTIFSESICEGDIYTFYGTDIVTGGIYTHVLQSSNLCDSVIILNLDILDTHTTYLSEEICEGSNIDFHGTTLSQSGVYNHVLANQNMCDSILILDLIVNEIDTTQIGESLCEGEVYNFFGTDISSTGLYYHTLFNTQGCDSVIELNILILPVDTTIISYQGCEGDIYNFFGTDITGSGIFYHTEMNSFGCDSVFELHTLFSPVDTTYLTEEICEGDSLLFYGNVITASGNYSHLLMNQFGCDSLLELDLTVNPTFDTLTYGGFCEYTSYIFYGNILDQPGTYFETLTTTSGCDSIIILELEEWPADTFYLEESICEGDTLFLDGLQYTTQGSYNISYVNQFGCDSIYNLDLTVNDLPYLDLGPDFTIFNNESIILNPGPGFISYLWSNGETSQMIDFDGSQTGIGDFEVWLEVYNSNCSSSDTLVISVVDYISVINPESDNGFEIYPNPVVDILQLKSDYNNLPFTARIFDITGSLIEEKEVFTDVIEFDFSNKAEGMYILEIISNKSRKTIPIIKL